MTVFTHAAVPLLAGRDFVPDGVSRRRFFVAAVLVACLPDLDLIAYLYDVHPPALLAHRGVFHSLLFAAVLSGVGALAFPNAFLRAWRALFVWAASHGVLDAFTRGDFGVALLAPIRWRVLWPVHPVPVTPLGADEALGRWGLLVLLNEALLVVVPVMLLARALAPTRSLRRLGLYASAWLVVVAGAHLGFPDLIAPSSPRQLLSFGPEGSDEDPRWIPREGLPDAGLVTRFDELRALGLFDRELVPAHEPWASSFFPSWLGGAAGRWQDGRLALVSRTIFRTRPPTLDEAARLGDRLSPTEKYDALVGDSSFTATRLELEATHNATPRPRFWFGICNGVAAAALVHAEPSRAVDAPTPDGGRVRFLPNDVKALLGLSYFRADEVVLGAACDQVGFDVGRVCSMNPGGLVLALTNRLGLAHESFLLDVYPSMRAQNFAVAGARVNVVRGPFGFDGRAASERLKSRVASLVDVEVQLALATTMLPYEEANVREPDGSYARVGPCAVPYSWTATLALDAAGEIIGGEWTGEPPDGPDALTFLTGGPRLVDGGVLFVNPGIRWQVVDSLARQSEGCDL